MASAPQPKSTTPKVNYYETLGIEKNASMQDITKSYRKLALKYHPDRNRGAKLEEATEKFKTVSEAYATLSDVSKRRHYDLHGTGGMDEKVGLEAVDVENVGWLGRFLAAQVAKLGIHIFPFLVPLLFPYCRVRLYSSLSIFICTYDYFIHNPYAYLLTTSLK